MDKSTAVIILRELLPPGLLTRVRRMEPLVCTRFPSKTSTQRLKTIIGPLKGIFLPFKRDYPRVRPLFITDVCCILRGKSDPNGALGFGDPLFGSDLVPEVAQCGEPFNPTWGIGEEHILEQRLSSFYMVVIIC